MKTKHTPGPWRTMASPRIKGIGWTQIGTIELGCAPIAKILPVSAKGHRKATDFDEESANAALIAAAPELLAVAKAFCMEHTTPCGCENCRIIRKAEGLTE